MNPNRRKLVAGSIAALPLMAAGRRAFAQQATNLKISHQFPSAANEDGDFRDRLAKRFAASAEKATNGSLKFSIFPGSSLMKVNAQTSALRKGALDLAVIPLNYLGGEIPELNIALMPGLVTSYEQGSKWKDAEIGKALTQVLADKGLVILTWVWQGSALASRAAPIVGPEDAKGLKIRGGSREMDLALQSVGASVISGPSSEVYVILETGAADAAISTSTSLMSFRSVEVARNLTIGQGTALWFVLEPLLMSRIVFDRLTKEQQAAIQAAGVEAEKFGNEAAKIDDKRLVEVYSKGGKVIPLPDAALKKWQGIARETAWKDFASKSDSCARLLALADKVK